MKRMLSLLLALLISLVLCSCSSPVDVDAIQESAYQEGYNAGYAAALAEITPAPSETPLITPEPAEEPTPEPTQEIGSRKSPAPIGTEVGIIDADYGAYTMTCTEILRGADAWAKIQEANRFNEEPLEGKEYILAKFSVLYRVSARSDDAPLELGVYNFDVSDSSYSVSDKAHASLVLPEPAFDLTLYEGASNEGWVVFEVPTDEAAPLAVWDELAWFQLYQ